MTVRIFFGLAVGLMIAALVLRTFVLLGFIVPVKVAAGSMVPTLLGPHKTVICDACGQEFPVSVDTGWASFSATCPGCGRSGIDISGLPVVAGDAIWVDRTRFLLRSPRRWEIVVFRSPTDATQLCVKRIVGLPGEIIELRDGKVFINGERTPSRQKRKNTNKNTNKGSGTFFRPWQLGPNAFFVLGDNSEISDDSRTWSRGPGLPRKLLVGKLLRIGLK